MTFPKIFLISLFILGPTVTPALADNYTRDRIESLREQRSESQERYKDMTGTERQDARENLKDHLEGERKVRRELHQNSDRAQYWQEERREWQKRDVDRDEIKYNKRKHARSWYYNFDYND